MRATSERELYIKLKYTWWRELAEHGALAQPLALDLDGKSLFAFRFKGVIKESIDSSVTKMLAFNQHVKGVQLSLVHSKVGILQLVWIDFLRMFLQFFPWINECCVSKSCINTCKHPNLEPMVQSWTVLYSYCKNYSEAIFRQRITHFVILCQTQILDSSPNSQSTS